MEATPKVHRHRHRRSNSKRNQERFANSNQDNVASTSGTTATVGSTSTTNRTRSNRRLSETDRQSSNDRNISGRTTETPTPHDMEPPSAVVTNEIDASDAVVSGDRAEQKSRTSKDTTETPSQSSLQTVVLVNGQAIEDVEDEEELTKNDNLRNKHKNVMKSPTAPLTPAHESIEPDEAANSGETLSLREMLQQHRPTTSPSGSHRRRTHSPHSPHLETSDRHVHRGILGFIDREQKAGTTTSLGAANSTLSVGSSKKMQSLSDPQASPAQRSTRSRSSIDKSPRRKRSKSESRRRRERKLIAAGEMEVRQANETLMRYLKQCSEMNDASLSGELEIDHNFDERRVHRKTKSQRDKRGQLISKTSG